MMKELVRAAEDLNKTIVLDETTKRPSLMVSDRCMLCDPEE